jgi:hypothetical protein
METNTNCIIEWLDTLIKIVTTILFIMFLFIVYTKYII